VRLAFLGSGAFGRATLAALVEAGLLPALVVTQPFRRRRRGGAPEPTPVQAFAEERRLDVFAPEDVNAPESLARLRAAGADLFVVSEYGQILRQALLDIPPLGSINVHASLLPRHRGATPVEAAILAGDAETGVTIQRVVRRLDAGPVLAARAVPLRGDEDAGSLREALAALGGALAVEVVRAFARGDAPAGTPQDDARATLCRRLAPGDLRVDWRRSAAEIERQVRALHPRPGARAALDREPPLEVHLLRAAVAGGRADPGVVAAVGADSFDVGTGGGLLRVLELAPASKRPMRAGAFRNGYRLAPGERFR
jgi:methionyl-tRNA formyltransferase